MYEYGTYIYDSLNIVVSFVGSFQEKIEKATAAIEAAKKSGEEFNKGHFHHVFRPLCVVRKINSYLRVVLFCSPIPIRGE